ncbi:acyltransferase [Alkaliphilus crotonatoxidans]
MKKRIEEIPYLRGMAGLAVVMVHLSAIPIDTLGKDSLAMALFTLINRGLKFTSPVFIFISGLIFFYSYKNRPFQYFSFLRKRLNSVLIPYLGWSLFYYLFYVGRGIYVFDIKFLINGLLLGRISYHFYFMVIIIQFYLLFGLFYHAFKRFNPHVLLIAAAIINLISLNYLNIQYSDRFFTNYIFFFSFGCYWAYYFDEIKVLLKKYAKLVYGAYGAAALLYAGQFYYYYAMERPINVVYVDLMWFIFCTVSICFCYQISSLIVPRATEKIKAVGQFVSRCSFITYLSHPFFIYLSEGMLNRLGLLSISRRFLLNVMIVYGGVFLMEFIYLRLILPFLKKTFQSRAMANS